MDIVSLFRKHKRLTHFTLLDNLSLSSFTPLPSLHAKLLACKSVIRVNMHNWSSLFAQVPTPHNGRIMEEHFRHRCSLFITLLSVTLLQSKGREPSAWSCLLVRLLVAFFYTKYELSESRNLCCLFPEGLSWNWKDLKKSINFLPE